MVILVCAMGRNIWRWFVVIQVCLLMVPAGADDDLTRVSFRTKWVPQAQFAGFYVAAAKGFYAEEGLEVEIRPGGPGISALSNVASGKDTFTVEWLMNAMALASKEAPVVNIAQLFQSTGLMLLSHKRSGIDSVEAMDGKRVGVWPALFQVPPSVLMKQHAVNPVLVTQLFSMDDFIAGRLDVASAMIYNEYHVVLESGISPDDLNIFHFRDYALDFPDDGLYVNANTLAENPEMVRAFTRASMRGWRYAIDHPQDTLAIVMAVVERAGTGSSEAHQRTMLQEVSRLILVDKGVEHMGELEERTFDFVQRVLGDANFLETTVEYEKFYRPMY